MWSLAHGEELDDVISRINGQASSLSHPCLTTTSRSVNLKHSVDNAQTFVAGARESIRKREKQLRQQTENCLKLGQGSAKARLTIENILSYSSSKQTQGAKMSLILHDNPICYLKDVVEIYSIELRACDTALNGLQWTAPVKAGSLEQEDITLPVLIATTNKTIFELTSKFQNASWRF